MPRFFIFNVKLHFIVIRALLSAVDNTIVVLGILEGTIRTQLPSHQISGTILKTCDLEGKPVSGFV